LIGYQALDEGIGLGKLIGLGNRCNVEFADLLPFWQEINKTRCLVLFIEGLEDPGGSWQPSGILSPKKPIVAMKAGRTSASQRPRVLIPDPWPGVMNLRGFIKTGRSDRKADAG